MLKKLSIVLAVLLLIVPSLMVAGNGNGPGDGSGENCTFIDENGDGINDNFRDHDGDGIANHLDPDWIKPEDGTGYKNRRGNAGDVSMRRNRRGNKARTSQGFGAGFGSGVCDGSGPQNSGVANRNRGSGKGGGRG